MSDSSWKEHIFSKFAENRVIVFFPFALLLLLFGVGGKGDAVLNTKDGVSQGDSHQARETQSKSSLETF